MNDAVPHGARLTHVFLDGGRACVPGAERGCFLDAYARDVEAGRPLFVVERTGGAGNVYRFFADLDVHLPDEVAAKGAEAADDVLKAVMRTVCLALPDELARGRVAVFSRQAATDRKVGAHMVWSSVFVNDAAALRVRGAWLDRVQAASEQPRALEDDGVWVPDDWDAVIDSAVYRNSGLRMPWSRKRGSDATYVPMCVMDYSLAGHGSVSISEMPGQSVREWVELGSLWPNPPDFTLPEGAVLLDEGVPLADIAGARQSHKHPPPSGSRDTRALTEQEAASLRAVLPGPYKACSFNRVRVLSCGDVVIGLDSTYCMHAGREHGSSSVYLVARRASGALDQRCFAPSCREHTTRVVDRHPLASLMAATRPALSSSSAATTAATSARPAGSKKAPKRAAASVHASIVPRTAADAVAAWQAARMVAADAPTKSKGKPRGKGVRGPKTGAVSKAGK